MTEGPGFANLETFVSPVRVEIKNYMCNEYSVYGLVITKEKYRNVIVMDTTGSGFEDCITFRDLYEKFGCDNKYEFEGARGLKELAKPSSAYRTIRAYQGELYISKIGVRV